MFVSGSSFSYKHDGICNSASLGSKKHGNPEQQNLDQHVQTHPSALGKGLGGLLYCIGRLVTMTQCKTCTDN